MNEQPVLFANLQAGPSGPLHNPTAMDNGWAPLLQHPNPMTRDALMSFMHEFTFSSPSPGFLCNLR
jgi:hypothetical protein